MSLGYLNEEGLAELEEIKIPFSIILLFSILLIILYVIHFNGHFYIFGLLARILFHTYEIWTIIQDALFYWYFLLHFNYEISSDISQNIINLPVYANTPHIYDPPRVQHNKQLEEFLRGEIRCQNFINQDLTFYNHR